MSVLNTASSWRDSVGIIASVGCAVHCAAMPFVIAYLPVLGLSFLADEAFHRWMALACFVIAMAAFVPGFRMHKRFLPGLIAAVGLVMISAAAFGLAGDCCVACETNAKAIACTDACCEHGVTNAVAATPVHTQVPAAGVTYRHSSFECHRAVVHPVGRFVLGVRSSSEPPLWLLVRLLRERRSYVFAAATAKSAIGTGDR